jgi:hypothetical protein
VTTGWRTEALISIQSDIIIWAGKLWNVAQWILETLSQGITRLYNFRESETMLVHTHIITDLFQYKSRFNPLLINVHLSTCNFWLFLWIQNKCTRVLLIRPPCCFLEAYGMGFMFLIKFFGGIWQLVSEIRLFY